MVRHNMSDSASEDDDNDEYVGVNNPKCYLLPRIVQFGYHKKNHASQTEVSSDGLSATKTNPQKDYAGGVVYSEKPLQGTCEFEVEMTKYGTGWSGNLKLGITLVGKNEGPPKVVPRYSPEGNEVCVWCDSKLFDRIIKRNEKVYGKKRLDDLREGDRLGLQITKDGTLSFFINGKHQGIALCDVYKPDHDVYAIVDHYGNAISTTITKSVTRVNINLQKNCLDQISLMMCDKSDIDLLPLPDLMKDKLKLYSYER